MILFALGALGVLKLLSKLAEWRVRHWRSQLHAAIVEGYAIQRDADRAGVTLSPSHAAALREAENALLDGIEPC